jgi:hypothetical protein
VRARPCMEQQPYSNPSADCNRHLYARAANPRRAMFSSVFTLAGAALNCCKSARVENGAFEVSGPVDLVVDGWPEAALHEGALQDEFFHTPRSRIPALRRKPHVGLVLRASGLDQPKATGRRPLVAEGTFDIVG